MPSRRALLTTAALAAPALLARRSRAAPPRKVKLTLPWLAEGSNAVAYVAKQNGYWADAGLDVEISRGYGSIAAAQAVGAGQFEFGLAAASAGIQQVAKGLPLTALTCLGYDATMSVAVLDSSPYHAPKDLNGKSIGCTVNSGEYAFLPAFAQASGWDLASSKIVQVDPNVRQRVLMEKQVDAISGFAISIAPVLVANGLRPRFMLFSAQGIKSYNNMLLTKPDTLKADPKTCAALAEGLNKAAKFCLLQPADALAAFIKQVPETALVAHGADQVRTGMGIFCITLLGAPAKSHAVGWSDPADYAAMTELVMKYAADKTDKAPDPAALFTNDFAGSVTLSPDEWAKAEANVKEYRDFFA